VITSIANATHVSTKKEIANITHAAASHILSFVPYSCINFSASLSSDRALVVLEPVSFYAPTNIQSQQQ
jgi:hypothetical protein